MVSANLILTLIFKRLIDIKPMYHDTWTINGELFFQPLPTFFLICSFILTGVFWKIWQIRDKTDFIWGPKDLGASDKNLKLFYGWVPLILGVHVAIPLIVNGVQGRLFVSNHLLGGLFSHWIGLIEILIGLSLFYGGLTRLAALFMAVLWLIGIDLVGARASLISIQYLGYAIFFYLAGRGPYAIDRILFPKFEPKVIYAGSALLLLRIGVGLTFIFLGFAEKFAKLSFPIPLLEQQPHFAGLPDDVFFPLVGSLQIFGGLMILFGIFPRLVAIIALICINGSLTTSLWSELIDYLPLYAALAILLVWEPNNPAQKLLWVEGLRKDINDSSNAAFS